MNRGQVIIFLLLLFCIEGSAQEIYLLDSLFARSVEPSYGIEDSIYFEYDESNRLIKETNKYFYKVYSFTDSAKITSFYNTISNEKTGQRIEASEIVNGFGYKCIRSESYENDEIVFTSSDTSFFENSLPVRQVYWQSNGSDSQLLLFEVISAYTNDLLTSSLSKSYDNNQVVFKEEVYAAYYENDLIIWETTATTIPNAVSVVDSIFYSYNTANSTMTILKSYRNDFLNYCVKNEVQVTADYHIRTSFESHNCNNFTIQDSIVQYLSDFPIVEFDSLKSYRFIDNDAQLYRFEQNTLYFDNTELTVEVFRENFFSNRFDGVFNEVNSSNSFYSLKNNIETLDEPNSPQWMMYPNPAPVTSEVQLEIRNMDTEALRMIKIYSSSGELIETMHANGDKTRLPRINTPGLYFIQLFDQSNRNSETRSLLVF